MAWFVYSPEAFPGTHENGRKYEYVQVLGHQVILKENTWTKLEGRFTKRRFDSYLDETGHEDVFLADEIAEAISRKYGFRGVMVTEALPGSDTCKALEAESKERNLTLRRAIILEFEQNRYHAQMTGFGRLTPTLFEVECYKLLGQNIPSAGFANENKPISVTMPPELTELLKKLTEQVSGASGVGSGAAQPVREQVKS